MATIPIGEAGWCIVYASTLWYPSGFRECAKIAAQQMDTVVLLEK